MRSATSANDAKRSQRARRDGCRRAAPPNAISIAATRAAARRRDPAADVGATIALISRTASATRCRSSSARVASSAFRSARRACSSPLTCRPRACSASHARSRSSSASVAANGGVVGLAAHGKPPHRDERRSAAYDERHAARARRSGACPRTATTTSVDAASRANAKQSAATSTRTSAAIVRSRSSSNSSAASSSRVRTRPEQRGAELRQRAAQARAPAPPGVPSLTCSGVTSGGSSAGRRRGRPPRRCRSPATDCRARSRRSRVPPPWRGRPPRPRSPAGAAWRAAACVSTCERRSRALSPVSTEARFSISSASASTAAKIVDELVAGVFGSCRSW